MGFGRILVSETSTTALLKDEETANGHIYFVILSSFASRASTSSFDKRSTIGSYTSHSFLFLKG